MEDYTKKLIDFTNNHEQLIDLKNRLVGSLKILKVPNDKRDFYFLPLFQAARNHFVNENIASGDILNISKYGINQYLKYYADLSMVS